MVQPIEKLRQRKRPTTEISSLFPLQGNWTADDYFKLPETNRFIELSEGRLIIPKMPTSSHQNVVKRLFVKMNDFVEREALGDILFSPLPVRLGEKTVREPDIVFMSKAHRSRTHEAFWEVPGLVVEVISSTTEQTDRGEKFSEYQRAGVLEYWIVHPAEYTIEVYVLRQGKYQLSGKWGSGEDARSEILAGFEVEVDTVVV